MSSSSFSCSVTSHLKKQFLFVRNLRELLFFSFLLRNWQTASSILGSGFILTKKKSTEPVSEQNASSITNSTSASECISNVDCSNQFTCFGNPKGYNTPECFHNWMPLMPQRHRTIGVSKSSKCFRDSKYSNTPDPSSNLEDSRNFD